ncbi:MAG: hypothetical protein R3225_01820, partial [Halofilum sp. (in: g-proteobacteria)]|nr:hypothetical protein [Halofilum sp. (in: g-proteobacteria)]
MRLGVLYPPCGAEFEFYTHGEALAPDVRVTLVGVRIHGGDDEHAVGHMRRTAEVDNLLLSAEAIAPLRPDAAIWACTSGSFVAGLGHARRQAEAIGEALGCPATSTALAYLAALQQLGIERVSVLASYPQAMFDAFQAFLGEAGIGVDAGACLDVGSGPAAADIGDEALLARAAALAPPPGGALLIPDTAIPTLHLLPRLAELHEAPVLTANQVSLWLL